VACLAFFSFFFPPPAASSTLSLDAAGSRLRTLLNCSLVANQTLACLFYFRAHLRDIRRNLFRLVPRTPPLATAEGGLMLGLAVSGSRKVCWLFSLLLLPDHFISRLAGAFLAESQSNILFPRNAAPADLAAFPASACWDSCRNTILYFGTISHRRTPGAEKRREEMPTPIL